MPATARMHPEALYQALMASLAEDGVGVYEKADSRLCRIIDRALRILTCGKQDRFLKSFVTTLGQRIYVPEGWEHYPLTDRYLTMRHEAVHVRQFRRLTWPGMILTYLLLPLPMGLAAGRAWLEWQAYRETIVATWQLLGPEAAHTEGLADHIVGRFTSADYAWMWLSGRQVRRWIARTLAELEANPPPPLTLEDPSR